jgi:hypothetical protein
MFIIISIIAIMACKNVSAEETTGLLSCAVNKKLIFFNMCKIYLLDPSVSNVIFKI